MIEVIKLAAFISLSSILIVICFLAVRFWKNKNISFSRDDYMEVSFIDTRTNEWKTKKILRQDAVDKILQ